MVTFNFATADADTLMNEIIRITLTEYYALSEKITKPCPLEEEQEMVDAMMEKYLDNERILDAYFARLKELLRESPPGRLELEMKQRQIETLIKKHGLNFI